MLADYKTWWCDVGKVIAFQRPRRKKHVGPRKSRWLVTLGWRIAATLSFIVATILLVFRIPACVGLIMLGGLGAIGIFFTWLLTEPTNWQRIIHCAGALFGSIILWHVGDMTQKYMHDLTAQWSANARNNAKQDVPD